MSRMSASAVWKATSPFRPRWRPRTAPQPASRSRVSAGADARRAGTSPHTSAVNTVAPNANSSVGPFTAARSSRGTPCGATRMKTGTATTASTMATAPASTATSPASVRPSRISVRRPAPSARRTAISRIRRSARTKKRFATFAHAMRRTNPTAASSTQRGPRTSPSTCSSMVRITGWTWPLPIISA